MNPQIGRLGGQELLGLASASTRMGRLAARFAALAILGATAACDSRSDVSAPVDASVRLLAPEAAPADATVTTELRYEDISAKQARLDAEASATSVTETAALVAWLAPAPFARIAHLTDVQVREERGVLFSERGQRLIEVAAREHLVGEGTKRQPLQEANSPFVWLAEVLTLNAIHAQRPFDLAIHTGDSVDIGLRSELAHFLFVARKLDMPFLAASGNHDVLAFGVWSPDRPAQGIRLETRISRDGAVEPAFRENDEHLLAGRPTFARAFREISTALGPHAPTQAKLGSVHHGHDLAAEPDDLFYTVTVRAPGGGQPGLQVIVLETSREDGGAEGEILDRQVAFLNDTLDAPATRASVVVVAAHHPVVEVLRHDRGLGEMEEARVSAALGKLHAILSHYPNVVLYLCGHTHLPEISEVRDPATGELRWTQIDSGALLVYPQEGAIVELVLGPGATEISTRARKIGPLVDPASPLGRRVAEARAAAAKDEQSRPRYEPWTTYEGTRPLPAFPVGVQKFKP